MHTSSSKASKSRTHASSSSSSSSYPSSRWTAWLSLLGPSTNSNNSRNSNSSTSNTINKNKYFYYGQRALGAVFLLALFYTVLRFLVTGFSACDSAVRLTALDRDEEVARSRNRDRDRDKDKGKEREIDTHFYNHIESSSGDSATATRKHLKVSALVHPKCMDKWLTAPPLFPYYADNEENTKDNVPSTSSTSSSSSSSSSPTITTSTPTAAPPDYQHHIAQYVQGKYRSLGFDVIKPLEHQLSLLGVMNEETNSRPWMQCDHEKLRTVSVSFAASSSAFFQPHHYVSFAQYFLRFYSLLIWQSRSYRVVNHEACVHTYAIDENHQQFWHDISLLNSPVDQKRKLVQYVSELGFFQTLTTNKCDSVVSGSGFQKEVYNILLDDDEQYFLHPADSFLLTNLILNRDPCQLYQQGNKLAGVNVPANVTLLLSSDHHEQDNFYVDHASFSNVHKILSVLEEFPSNHFKGQQAVHQKHGNTIHSKMVVIHDYDFYFDIAKGIFESDIVIAFSLEALQYIHFLKPCSVVVAVLLPSMVNENNEPYETIPSRQRHEKLYDPDMIKFAGNQEWLERLASSVDVIYHSHELKWDNSIVDSDFVIHHPHCQQFLPFGQQKQTLPLHLPTMCARGIKGWELSKEDVHLMVKNALASRDSCVQRHTFYSNSN